MNGQILLSSCGKQPISEENNSDFQIELPDATRAFMIIQVRIPVGLITYNYVQISWGKVWNHLFFLHL